MVRLSLNRKFCFFVMEGQGWAPVGWLEGPVSFSCWCVPSSEELATGVLVSEENSVGLLSLLSPDVYCPSGMW